MLGHRGKDALRDASDECFGFGSDLVQATRHGGLNRSCGDDRDRGPRQFMVVDWKIRAICCHGVERSRRRLKEQKL